MGASRTSVYSGVNVLQNGFDAPNFKSDNILGATFAPDFPSGVKVDSSFTNTHVPLESSNIYWGSIVYSITRQANITPQDYLLVVKLYGINTQNNIELIGEDVLSTCSATETTETRIFDLLNCASHPPLTVIGDTATTGKIQLDLPMRMGEFEHVYLYDSATDTQVTPDTYSDDDHIIYFTTPGGWASLTQAYIGYQEYGNNEYNTNPVNVSDKSILQMGYNSLDGFNGLRLVFELSCTPDYETSISEIIYKYEVGA